SYTRFQYSGLKLSAHQLPLGGKLTVSATITNTGEYEADEIVQLYTRQLSGSMTRPVRASKGFRRIRVKPGEITVGQFTVGTENLAFWGDRMQWTTEPGKFH